MDLHLNCGWKTRDQQHKETKFESRTIQKTTISVRGEIEFTRGGFGGRRGCRRGRGIWSPWGGARRRGGGCGRARSTPRRSRHRARALPWALIARTSPPPNSPPPSTPTSPAAAAASFRPSGDLWLDAFPVVWFRGRRWCTRLGKNVWPVPVLFSRCETGLGCFWF